MMKYIISLLALSLSGCLPIPVQHIDSPELNGVVSRNGVPIIGVRVCVIASYHKQPSCVMTHGDGKFSLRAMSTSGYVSFIGERVSYYDVTLQTGTSDSVIGFRQSSVGREPRSTLLKCDLSRPINGSFGNSPTTYCHATEN
jgi:hypothetical protein